MKIIIIIIYKLSETHVGSLARPAIACDRLPATACHGLPETPAIAYERLLLPLPLRRLDGFGQAS